MVETKSVLTGTCGFPGARGKYFGLFPCVEVNITFYQLPALETAEKWRREAESANPGFEFVVKAWQLITHPVNPVTYRRLRERLDPAKRGNYGFFRDTPEVKLAWSRTAEFCRALGAKKVLFQTPPAFRPTPENLDNVRGFFEGFPHGEFTPLFEPRGEAWAREATVPLCRACGLVHAVDPLYADPFHGAFRYYRLHGGRVGGRIDYGHRFTSGELREVLGKCDRSLNYVMFNNASMLEDALRFRRLAARSTAGNTC